MIPLILLCGGILVALALASFGGNGKSLNIKARTVGDGQHGTARWATSKEIRSTYRHISYTPMLWRRGENRPSLEAQGLVVGCVQARQKTTALVDRGDVHLLMIGAAGVGKTANFLFPNLEYACATGMSVLVTDTKGDVFRSFAGIARKYYGYNISVIDLRNPARSDGSNMIALVNKYMDLAMEYPDNLVIRARAEKYAKITSKMTVMSLQMVER